MRGQLALAIVAIIFGAGFYTIGVWGERFSGRLKLWRFALFAIGLICDTNNFYKFSTTVWLIWLVPFVSGMVGAMMGTMIR